MRRRPVLALAAALVLASAGAASAATGDTTTDTVLVTSTGGLLTMVGGAVPTTAVAGAIGGTTAVPGNVMTVEDLRGRNLGWDVTALYAAPPASTSIGGVVTPITDLGASAVKVTTSTGVTTTLNGVFSYKSAVALSTTTAVNVASATSATSGGVTTFNTGYAVTLPSNAATGTVYGGSVSYTVAPLLTPAP